MLSDEAPRGESQRDFFVSYTSADQRWAEWIAWTLEDAGYSVVIQAWDFRAGNNFILEMQRAASQAKRTIAVLSPAYLQAIYVQPEWAEAVRRDPTGEQGTLVPVVVEPCRPEGLLAPIIRITLAGLSKVDAAARLLERLQDGRRKPAEEPEFPGPAEGSVPHVQPIAPVHGRARTRAIAALERGRQRFEAAASRRRLQLPTVGYLDVGIAVSPDVLPLRATRTFLDDVLGCNPQTTDWPLWMDSRRFPDPDCHPQVIEGAWDAFVVNLVAGLLQPRYIDSWVIVPDGTLSHRRAFAEDFPHHGDAAFALEYLDIRIPVLELAEAISLAPRFAAGFRVGRGSHAVALAFRWSRLGGRRLMTWTATGPRLVSSNRSHQDDVVSTIVFPAGQAVTRDKLEALIGDATQPLYELFGGYEMPRAEIQQLIARVLPKLGNQELAGQ